MDKHHWFGFLLICCSTFGPTYALKTYYMEDLCHKYSNTNIIEIGRTNSGHDSSVIVKATEYFQYRSGSNCTVYLNVPAGHGIVIAIGRIDVRPSCVDMLTITGECYGEEYSFCSDYNSYSREWKNVRLCGSGTLKFNTDISNSWTYSGFQLTVTAHRLEEFCSSSEYKCNNGRCISISLACDDHNHCGDRSEQTNCNEYVTMSPSSPSWSTYSSFWRPWGTSSTSTPYWRFWETPNTTWRTSSNPWITSTTPWRPWRTSNISWRPWRTSSLTKSTSSTKREELIKYELGQLSWKMYVAMFSPILWILVALACIRYWGYKRCFNIKTANDPPPQQEICTVAYPALTQGNYPSHHQGNYPIPPQTIYPQLPQDYYPPPSAYVNTLVQEGAPSTSNG